jgi:hypothetical protein
MQKQELRLDSMKCWQDQIYFLRVKHKSQRTDEIRIGSAEMKLLRSVKRCAYLCRKSNDSTQ